MPCECGIETHQAFALTLHMIFRLLGADPARLRQVLINLIDNGIKFTPECGSITVNSRLFAEDDSFLCISVSDTGCGISPENCAMVFERLAQVTSTAQASRCGLGLGLFISRDLVFTAREGRFGSKAIWGTAALFYLTLPVFSLARLYSHIFTVPNLEAGFVTLIAVDVVWAHGVVPEIRMILGAVHSSWPGCALALGE